MNAPETPETALRSKILAADGTLLASLFVENREVVSYAELPTVLVDAVIAAEDQRFWFHEGVDAKAILRAAVANAGSGKVVQGGSTITQQYVKNVYFTRKPRTLEQKAKEALLARKLERTHTKQELMQLYLNTIYLGNGAYGVKAASEEYFRKNVRDLSLAEASLLATLIQGPEIYDPRRSPVIAKQRRDSLIDRMVSLKQVSPLEASTTKAEPLTITEPPLSLYPEPFFIDYVKRTIAEDAAFGETEADRADLLYRGGVTVQTSLDPHLQELARKAIAQILNRPGDPEASLVAIDPRTGRVLAMIGGRDYSTSQVNLAMGIKGGGTGRQPGSAFKPFVLAAAIEDGLVPSTLYPAANPVIRGCGPAPWRPRNIEGSGQGFISLEDAMINSVNAVYARLGADIGPSRVVRTAQRMGVTFSKLESVCPIALGSEEVSPLEMASAFGTFANHGVLAAATPITAITGPNQSRSTFQPRYTRAIDPGTAYLVTDTLTKVIASGTGTRAQIGRPAAGKTGTSQDNIDAWFVGYTPELVTAVWVGYPQRRIPMTNVHGTRVFGGTFPAMIWKTFMERALSDTAISLFEIPKSELVTIDIDPTTGLLAGPFCAGKQTVQMLRQLAPRHTCASPSPSPTVNPAPPPTNTATTTATASDPSTSTAQ